MTPERPFFLLLRSRRAWFRRQSLALYRRYAQLAGLLLMFCGALLAERPALLAEPILHFWRAPSSVLANAAWAGAWLACVHVWVRIHRDFIAGGALADFTRTLPGAVGAARLVDATMLLVSLWIFLLPAGLATWAVWNGGGAGLPFAARAALLGVLTLGMARLALGGARRLAWPLLGGAALLCGAGMLGVAEPWTMLLAALGVGAVLAHTLAGRAAAAPGRAVCSTPAMPAAPVRSGPGFLLRLSWIVLARRHPHAALPRLALAAAIQLAWLWMVFGVGKHAQSGAFVQAGCWLTIAVMSGFFPLFWSTRQPLEAWLRSLPHGMLRLALAEQLLVLLASAALFGAAGAACLLQPAHGTATAAQLLRHGGAALALLPLLGLPFIQRREEGLLIKIVILVASFLLL